MRLRFLSPAFIHALNAEPIRSRPAQSVFLPPYLTALCIMTTLSPLPIKGHPMSALYSGLPAATSVEQSIILAQLELLRRLDPARVEAAKAVLLRN